MLDITKLSEGDHRSLIKQFAKHKINRSKKLEYPEPLISLGEKEVGQNRYPIPFGTRGNFSAIQGGSKVGKTYFRSLLIASYIGGGATDYAPNFKTHREIANAEILDFDTEQGEWHAQSGATRVDELVGTSYQHYHPFYLREMDAKERVKFIEYCLYFKFKNIRMVVIDGIADLVNDVNSLHESNEIIQKLMSWSSELNIHIVVYIHTNWESDKATGHLGSAISKKAETVCDLKRDGDYTNVKFIYCRGFKPNDFKFCINKNGLPITEEEVPY